MKTFIAISMGFFSGFLLYMMVALLLVDVSSSSGTPPSPVFVLLTFLAGWILSTYLIRRGAVTITKVFSRGFLLGAAEWLGMILVGLVLSSRAVTTSMAQAGPGHEAAAAGAALGGGLIAFVTGGVSLVMALICLTGFAISFFIGREMKTEAAAPTLKCPECAEFIQAEARRCRFCGAQIVAPAEREG